MFQPSAVRPLNFPDKNFTVQTCCPVRIRPVSIKRELSVSTIFARHFTASLNCKAPSKPVGMQSIIKIHKSETKIETVERENVSFLIWNFFILNFSCFCPFCFASGNGAPAKAVSTAEAEQKMRTSCARFLVGADSGSAELPTGTKCR